MPVNAILGELRQEKLYEFEASLGYNVNLNFKKERERIIS